MKMRFLPDKPIETWMQDQLSLRDFVSQIRTAIENTETPFVFGVLGDWGTGKTSTLNLLKDNLITNKGTKPYFVPIWFNAWLYENEANIVYPLLYAIKKDYEERLKGFDSAKKISADLLKVVAASTLALTDISLRVVSKHFIGDAMKLSDIQEQVDTVLKNPGEIEQALSSWADQVGGLKKAYQSLIDTYALELAATLKDVSKKDIRFVILIDDLDRCLPQTAITILESVKNFLSADQCIYVFGLNPKVVYQGVQTKYQGIQINGREYLEKILNYNFYVPEPTLDDISKYAIKALENLSFDDKIKLGDLFLTFGQVLQECKFNNPRKVNRILNHYLRFIHTFKQDLPKYYLENIVKLCILGEYYPGIFAVLMNDETRADLSKIQSPEFRIKEFEDKHGVQIQSFFDQLIKTQKLLQFKKPTGLQQGYSFTDHWIAVSKITKLP
jgi:hypothetical protein